MSLKIRCYTLFDITKTGITNRRNTPAPVAEKITLWEMQRNTQCNFDTIIQVLSLRGLPEEITDPVKEEIVLNGEDEKFGFLLTSEAPCTMWSFEFSVMSDQVFANEVSSIGYLFTDCEGVPMIHTNSQLDKLPEFLDTTPELRNIYFEVIENV
jgi:hypothetical protein